MRNNGKRDITTMEATRAVKPAVKPAVTTIGAITIGAIKGAIKGTTTGTITGTITGTTTGATTGATTGTTTGTTTTTTATTRGTRRKRATTRSITTTNDHGMYQYHPNQYDNKHQSYIQTSSSSLFPHPIHSTSPTSPTQPLNYPLHPPPYTTTTQNSSPPSNTNNTPGGIRGGRWSPSEHELFLKGLRKHGRDWKAVSKFVPSRSSAQIRSHAQKYFNRLSHPSSTSNPSIFGSPEEGDGDGESLMELSVMGERYEDVGFWRKVESMVKEPEKVEVEVRRVMEELENKKKELERRIRERDGLRSSG
eukprot:CAMPEP_0118643316 /NCGR_PEP_ID=MMETSP0785-20121206/6326_1 /TAXON_ID=91992 /ORGANISM="Bolidomonas pacifica, Strain CCMP 1866" /LENGTH=306 /DNA_ID=CAMNT_0006534971 /DNA_START=110 /DNA_END=1026 /DNA_ORIENTATION=-